MIVIIIIYSSWCYTVSSQGFGPQIETLGLDHVAYCTSTSSSIEEF